MVRFFISPEEMHESFLVLTGENAAHAKVLRLKEGDVVTVCDGQGRECNCTVSDVSPGQVSLVTHGWEASQTEPEVRVRIFMAFPKADKLEHVIQKATELGASEITAFPSARCVSRPEQRAWEKKLVRWQKIAAAAAEQSGRGRIPLVTVLPTYEAALREAAQAVLPILFYENEENRTLSMVLAGRAGLRSVSLMTGPEGGLEPEEVQQACRAGLEVCTLGRRILRCETAPLCAISAVMFAFGEF